MKRLYARFCFVLLYLQPFVGNYYEERHIAAHSSAGE